MRLYDVCLHVQEQQQAGAYGSTPQGWHLVRMETSWLPSTMLTMSMPLTSPAARQMPLPGAEHIPPARITSKRCQLLASVTLRAATSHRLLQGLQALP